MDQAIIKTKNLGKTYVSGSISNQVISNLNMEIKKGEFIVIMGSSGTGKSTLLNLLSGLDNVSEGEVWIDGQPIHKKSEKELALIRRERIGFIFQSANLIPNLTVLENILISGFLSEGSRKNIIKKASSLLAEAGLSGLEKRFPSQLSVGQQQRVSIIRALINDPKILMVDEPTGNLNSSSSKSVLELLFSFHLRGQTILMVTHDVFSACKGQRILYFNDGKVIDEYVFAAADADKSDREKELTSWLLRKGW